MPGAHRDSMLRNLAVSLIEHELIKTTLPRAKELRRVAEPLITHGEGRFVGEPPDDLQSHAQRSHCRQAVQRTRPALPGSPGGYTRILKCGLSAR
jgi:large subunit ribosomal protein L17